MQFRHEVKHEISYADMLALRQRLRAVMKPDPYAKNGVYHIRSLYFDNLDDKALREKLDGVSVREKFRIRLYNHDTSVIKLERKYKCGSLGLKDSVTLTPEEANAIAVSNIEWMASSSNDLLIAFYSRMREDRLSAKVIVDYTREPFVFAPGNVRVTLDYNIRTGVNCKDFLNPHCITVPIVNDANILEVKWDNYLPDCIRNAIQLDNRKSSAFSKYAACRMYD